MLGFTDEEMPPDKVPIGLIILKVARLSASMSSNSHGFIVLARKGVGIETEMFREYDRLVTVPFVLQTRLDIARVDDRTEQVPNYLRSMLSNDGGMAQMKAIQGPVSLNDKRAKNIEQLKYAKQTSGVIQPADTGNLHVRERHHAKHISIDDIPTIDLINPLAEQLQQLRDLDHWIVSAKTIEHLINTAIRPLTILLKSSDRKCNQQAFYIPGIIDKGRQGPDVDMLMKTCKKNLQLK